MVTASRTFSVNINRISGRVWLGTISLFLVAFLLLPLAYLFIRASDDPSAGVEYVQQEATRSLVNSLQLALAVGVASVAIGVPLAWLTVRTDLKWRRIWTVLSILPLVIPSYVGAFALIAALGPKGMLQGVLEDIFGVERLPDIRGFFGAWLSITLFTFPYVFLSVRAGLRGVDPQLEEASRVLGENAWGTFRKVTFPQLMPSIQAGAILAMLYALSDFGAVAFMRYNAFTRVLFRRYLFSPEQTAALALVLVAMAILLLIIATRLEGNSKIYYRRSTKQSAQLIELGRWQLPAQLFCGMIVFIGLIAPTGVILYWLVNGLREGETLNDLIGPMQRSMRVAGVSAGIAGLVALPIAFMQTRFAGRFSTVLRIGAYIGFAIPGVVVAIALVFFANRFRIASINLYQTFPLLIFAYLVRFLPQMLGPLGAALLQVNPHVEESALTLGRNPRKVLLSVTAPLIRSGWVAGVALVFLTVIKELPITLILSPTGFDTLATQIWAATEEAFYARAAAPALVLLFVSAFSMIYILEPDDD